MLDNRQIAALAAAIYGEARGESRKGKEAVAHTVYNRSQVAKVGLSDVVYGSYDKKFGQFSFANPQDSNANTVKNAPTKDKKGWSEAVKIAQSVANGREDGTLADPTNGATHYHTTAVSPSWSKAYPKTTKIGSHQFYKAPDGEVKGVVQKAAQSPYRRNDLVPADAVAGLVSEAPKGMAALAPNGLLAPQTAAYQPADMTRPIQYSNSANKNAQPYEGMVVHHDAAESLQQIADITNYPRDNGHMKGYHYAIDRDGNVAQLAPLDQRVNHVGQNPPSGSASHLSNNNSVAVVMLGAHEQQTPEQQAALQTLTGNLKDTGIDLNPTNIAYHGKGSTNANPVEGQQAANQLAGILAPTPSERPSLEGQLGYKPGGILAPDTAGSFSPVSTAAAAEMPKGILDARPYRHTGIPDTSSLLDARPDTLQVKGDPQSYVQPMSGQPSFKERPITEPTYMAGTNNGSPIPSTPAPAPVAAPTPVAPPTSLLDQKGGMPTIQAAPTGLLDTKGALPAAQPVALEPASPINTNPESFATDEEFLMNQPVVAAPQILQNPTPVAPTATAPQDPYSLQQQQAYTPPPQNSAMDVWQGKAQSGVDNTGQYDLNRSANGDIYRYSKAYDRTDVLDADGNYKGQHKGKIDGPVGNGGVSLPSFGGFNIKPETKMGERVRGFGGGMAGSMAGGILGPIGGILGGLIGRELAQGKNPMGLLNRNQNQGQQVGTFTQNGQLYPEAPTVQHFSDNSGRSRSEADAAKGSTGKSYSKSILDAAYGGSGGLF